MTIWRVGMEAVCVAKGRWRDVSGKPFQGPEKGDVLVVRSVVTEPRITRTFWQRRFGKKYTWLAFAAYPNELFHSERFRPALKNDAEIVERIKACRPARRQVGA